jgi:hypothetical protein
MQKTEKINSPPSLHSLFTDNNNMIGDLLKHAYYIQQLQSKLHEHLGPSLNTHCIIANYNNAVLTLHADTPTWAAKLRYLTPDILCYMHQQCHLTKLKTIRIKVMPTIFSPARTSIRQLTLSAKSAKLMKDVANTMPDQALRTSLLKLAKHSRSS